jgi:hypothetical protein
METIDRTFSADLAHISHEKLILVMKRSEKKLKSEGCTKTMRLLSQTRCFYESYHFKGKFS